MTRFSLLRLKGYFLQVNEQKTGICKKWGGVEIFVRQSLLLHVLSSLLESRVYVYQRRRHLCILLRSKICWNPSLRRNQRSTLYRHKCCKIYRNFSKRERNFNDTMKFSAYNTWYVVPLVVNLWWVKLLLFFRMKLIHLMVTFSAIKWYNFTSYKNTVCNLTSFTNPHEVHPIIFCFRALRVGYIIIRHSTTFSAPSISCI